MTVKESKRRKVGEMFVCGCSLVITKRTIREEHRRWRKSKVCGVDGCQKELASWRARHMCEEHDIHDGCKNKADDGTCPRGLEAAAKRARRQARSQAGANEVGCHVVL